MFIKHKVLGAAAALTLVGGVSTVGTMSAQAATTQCGNSCIQVFSPRFGTVDHPNFIESVRDAVAAVGQPTILGRASSTDPAGDFMATAPGKQTVADFFAAGMVSADVNSHYGPMHAIQLVYAPFGNPTSLCSGVGKTAFDNEPLSLQPCSVPGTTVFIIDTGVAPASEPHFFAILSGSTTDFVQPFVMTYLHQPPARIRLNHLQLGADGKANDTQLWSAKPGVAS